MVRVMVLPLVRMVLLESHLLIGSRLERSIREAESRSPEEEEQEDQGMVLD